MMLISIGHVLFRINCSSHWGIPHQQRHRDVHKTASYNGRTTGATGDGGLLRTNLSVVLLEGVALPTVKSICKSYHIQFLWKKLHCLIYSALIIIIFPTKVLYNGPQTSTYLNSQYRFTPSICMGFAACR